MCRWFDSAPGHQFLRATVLGCPFLFGPKPQATRACGPFCLCQQVPGAVPFWPQNPPFRFRFALCSQKIFENASPLAQAESLCRQGLMRVSMRAVAAVNWVPVGEGNRLRRQVSRSGFGWRAVLRAAVGLRCRSRVDRLVRTAHEDGATVARPTRHRAGSRRQDATDPRGPRQLSWPLGDNYPGRWRRGIC